MRAVIAPEPGGPEALQVVDRPDPVPGPDDLLVEVVSTAVNRADVMQRKGLYPPPPGASDVLGLELAGRVRAVGEAVDGWQPGDEVCAVVAGGGCAELALVPAATAMRLPPGVPVSDAGAVPEVFATAFDNVMVRGALPRGGAVLVHGGSSGVGTAAIQLAKRHGATVAVTASAGKLQACADLGADVLIDYREREDFDVALREALPDGVDVVLDHLGASYLERSLRCLAPEGRLVLIGLMGGARTEIDLSLLLRHRLTVTASTLRARPVEAKAALARRLEAEVWPGFADGSLRPVIHARFPLEEIAAAHELMESSGHVGKIVLDVA